MKCGWYEPVVDISIQSGGATRDCKYFEAPAVARVPLVKAGSSLEFRRRSRISLGVARNFSVLSWPPIIHGSTSLWKHPLPDVWIALIEDGSSTGRTCNRFNCINRWEATAGLTSVLTFHSFTVKRPGVFAWNRERSRSLNDRYKARFNLYWEFSGKISINVQFSGRSQYLTTIWGLAVELHKFRLMSNYHDIYIRFVLDFNSSYLKKLIELRYAWLKSYFNDEEKLWIFL